MNVEQKQARLSTPLQRTAREFKTELSMLLIFILFFVVMSFANEYFFTPKNLMNVMSQVSNNAIIAIGMTLVIVTAGIDLSVGATLGLSAMVGGMVLQSTQNVTLSICVMLAIGLVVGLINGVLVGYMEMPAFIVTLGMMQICRSLGYVISDGNSCSGFPEAFGFLGKGKLIGQISVYQVFILLLFAIFIFVMAKTKFGRYLYAIGSNPEAARVSGINIKFNTMMAYVFCGLLSATSGWLMTSRLMAVDPTYGKDMEMDAIAAVVIGGTSMMGGKGTLWGTLIGVFLVGFLRNALNLIGLNPFWQGSAVGAVIIIAVLIERLSSKRAK
ncbi:MAG: ABC transporter permease [Eubacteriales bacterium]|jgi:ribose transport system permease protein